MGRQELRAIISGDARQFNRTMGEVKRTAKRTAGTLVALGVTGIIKASRDASQFEKKLAEIGTLGGYSRSQLDGVGRQLLDLGAKLGATTDELTGGLYQALSAGIPSGNAMEFLELSAKTAKAGVTDTETAVDGLTTVLNAYGKNADEAGSVSDQFFQTIKLGKTTFSELAANIGKVAPTAAAAKVSTEQLFGAYATLTKQGQSTEVATTRIQSVISSLLKPSTDLQRQIKQLGFDSGTAALETLGLQGVLDQLANSVENDNTKLAELFPNVNALGGVLSLTGEKAKGANTDLDVLENSAGATGTAFEYLAETGATSFDQLEGTAKRISVTVGKKTLPVITEEVNKLNAALDTPEADRYFRDIADGAAGSLEVVRFLLEEIGKLQKFLRIPEMGGFLGGATGLQRGAMDNIGRAVTAEEIEAFKLIRQNPELAGGIASSDAFQTRLIEDMLRGGSTESITLLRNIELILQTKLPSATAGAHR